MNKLLVRLTNWEYWPFSILYFPVFFYYGWLALKYRSFFFFTSSNPGIEFGGMFGEKKSEIFDMLPKEFIPNTFLVQKGNLNQALEKADLLDYPIIVKPDIGERGRWVEKIDSELELKKYVDTCPVNFLIQELIPYPIELGVFYVRFPNEDKGRITSIVRKNFLTVEGDGQSTINQLLRMSSRAMLTANLESDYLKKVGHQVPEKGTQIEIESIGNHCRGTMFLNDAKEINEHLTDAFDKLSQQIPGFFFGRYDIRCKSYDDLKQLEGFKILELNGAGAEPGHIYQPGYALFKAYKDILWHLRVLADISAQNKKRGVPFWTFKRGYKKWMEHRRYNRLLSI